MTAGSGSRRSGCCHARWRGPSRAAGGGGGWRQRRSPCPAPLRPIADHGSHKHPQTHLQEGQAVGLRVAEQHGGGGGAAVVPHRQLQLGAHHVARDVDLRAGRPGGPRSRRLQTGARSPQPPRLPTSRLAALMTSWPCAWAQMAARSSRQAAQAPMAKVSWARGLQTITGAFQGLADRDAEAQRLPARLMASI